MMIGREGEGKRGKERSGESERVVHTRMCRTLQSDEGGPGGGREKEKGKMKKTTAARNATIRGLIRHGGPS